MLLGRKAQVSLRNGDRDKSIQSGRACDFTPRHPPSMFVAHLQMELKVGVVRGSTGRIIFAGRIEGGRVFRRMSRREPDRGHQKKQQA